MRHHTGVLKRGRETGEQGVWCLLLMEMASALLLAEWCSSASHTRIAGKDPVSPSGGREIIRRASSQWQLTSTWYYSPRGSVRMGTGNQLETSPPPYKINSNQHDRIGQDPALPPLAGDMGGDGANKLVQRVKCIPVVPASSWSNDDDGLGPSGSFTGGRNLLKHQTAHAPLHDGRRRD